MITETATVVKVSPDAIWVKAIQKSACGSCNAKKGCGQSLLAEWAEKKAVLRIDDLSGFNITQFNANDQVVIGVPENVVMNGSLLLYSVPLLGLVIGAILGNQLFSSDIGTAVVAFIGLFVGGYFAAQYSHKHSYQNKIKPVLMEHIAVG